MKRKQQVLMTLFCSATVLGQSLTGFAQDKTKPAEKAENHVFVRQDGKVTEIPGGGTWVRATGGEAGAHYSFTTSTDANGAAPQVRVLSNEFNFDSKVVKGAPYSAEGVTETIQTLGDGNRIVRTSSAKLYRDSAGRTRREQALSVVGNWPVNGQVPQTIHLSDPLTNTQYTLNPASKTANKMTVQRLTTTTAAAGEKVSIARVNGSGGNVTVNGEVKEVNGNQFKFVTDDHQTIVLSGEASEKATVELKARAQAEGVKTFTMTEKAGGVASFNVIPDAQINREALGTQVFEGVQAEGTRITMTIPAGQIGNERPIVTVNERWYSPELQTVVMTRNSDPRSGETTYRLTNINRNEPDPTLFQVPSDYTVKEGGFGFATRAEPLLRKIEAEKKMKNPNDN
jgi:hypothetical protein